MTTLSQFSSSGRHLASIVNRDSAGSTQTIAVDYAGPPSGCKAYASSSVAANALQDMLSITGRGVLNFVAAHTNDTTSRTVRLKITVDGTSVFDATSSAITTSGNGVVGIGCVVGAATTPCVVVFQPVRFYASCLVQIASSVLNDTTKITTLIQYEVDQ